MNDDHDDKLAVAQQHDPSNTDVETLTEALEPHDNVYGLINAPQGDLRETAPVHEPHYGH